MEDGRVWRMCGRGGHNRAPPGTTQNHALLVPHRQPPEAGTYIETSMALLSPISVRHFMVTFLKAATCRNYSDRVSDSAVTADHAHTDLHTCRHTYVYTLCTLIFVLSIIHHLHQTLQLASN